MTLETQTRARVVREVPRWVERTRRVLEILSTGGTVWITETAKPRERR